MISGIKTFKKYTLSYNHVNHTNHSSDIHLNHVNHTNHSSDIHFNHVIRQITVQTFLIIYPRQRRLQLINEKYKHSALTEKIINCAMQVHSALGNGFQEVIYQRSLAIEMEIQGLPFKREHEMKIFYKGQYVEPVELTFVDNKVMVEIKALVSLEDVHLAQAINYCEAYKIEIGLLINFGAKSLEFKRVQNRKVSEL